MKVACFCGAVYEVDSNIGPCLNCDRIAVLPPMTEAQAAEMLMNEVEDFLETI